MIIEVDLCLNHQAINSLGLRGSNLETNHVRFVTPSISVQWWLRAAIIFHPKYAFTIGCSIFPSKLETRSTVGLDNMLNQC